MPVKLLGNKSRIWQIWIGFSWKPTSNLYYELDINILNYNTLQTRLIHSSEVSKRFPLISEAHKKGLLQAFSVHPWELVVKQISYTFYQDNFLWLCHSYRSGVFIWNCPFQNHFYQEIITIFLLEHSSNEKCWSLPSVLCHLAMKII